jgi:hypothetical protein
MLMAVAALALHDSDLRPAVREHLAVIKVKFQQGTKSLSGT